jgi:uncharacterized repeat protein (TIGR01451 family)
MDFVTLLGARIRGPRLFATAGALAGVLLVLVLTNWPGGASAAPGSTDLALTKSDSPDPVAEGGRLTYTIQVRNLGAGDATEVVVTDPLSASDVDFVSATATGGTCEQKAKTVTCTLGTVNAGTTATVTIVVEPKKTGNLSNTATVVSPQDSTPTNNQATATTVVNQTGKAPKASCATPTITGTTGDDVITGTDRADVIVTLEGNDQVFAGGGKDLVCTDGGADFVNGGPGGDTAIGGADPDTLKGKGGDDLLKGKGGPDRLRGNAGNDTLNGGGSRDSCKGGAGSDTLIRCP